MIEVAKYRFMSWARKGIAANIAQEDTLGKSPAPPGDRATIQLDIDVKTDVKTETLPRAFELVGPGEIIGIQRDMIIRTEPLDWITNFEPNYQPFIEFYDEDFAWRYTPAHPVMPTAGNPRGERLRPWIILLIVKETEFKNTERQLPLPSVVITSAAALPPLDETWLWAHVHTDADIPAGDLNDIEKFLLSLNKKINDDPDHIYSRLVSPRRLEPFTGYHAFVVPAFEAGRRSGLGQDPIGVPAQEPSWKPDQTSVEMPVYFRWSFRTGEQADFESLVRKLKPRVMDERIGIRDMDASAPGFVRVLADGTPVLDAALEPLPVHAADPKTFGLEGAIKSPYAAPRPSASKFLDASTDLAFYQDVQNLLNYPETQRALPDEDPIVSIPFYGQNHARQRKEQPITLNLTAPGWYHQLNRDPRLRALAGFGTLAIQRGQENYVQKAWTQVQKIFDTNKLIRLVKAMGSLSFQQFTRYVEPLPTAVFLGFSAPLFSKIKGSPVTLRHLLRQSRLPEAALSPAMRRLLRPRALLSRRLNGGSFLEKKFEFQEVITQLNDGHITAATVKTPPEGLPTVDNAAGALGLDSIPDWLRWLAARALWLAIILLLLALLLGLLFSIWPLAIFIATVAVGMWYFLNNLNRQVTLYSSLTEPELAKEIIQKTPPRPGFQIRFDEDTAPGAPPLPAPTTVAGSPESFEATRFRQGAVDLMTRLAIRPPLAAPALAFDLGLAATKTWAAINPRKAFPNWLDARVRMPGDWGRLVVWEEIVPAMAYPDIEDPMYIPLRDINKENLLPNIDLIPPDTISLLETNPPFIEAYMVGLNHEMGRELLWREYPTDQRGSYFRQFWDIKGLITPNPTPADADAMKEIEPIHGWFSTSKLGTHKKGGPKERLVLLIRGELLKKYPNTVIYAQRAQRNNKGILLINDNPTHEEFAADFRFPIFKADVEPDIKFFGFEMTIEEAEGNDDVNDFGWFFIIQQIPGEARFGMDISYQPTDADNNEIPDKDEWDNLSWDKFPDVNAMGFIKANVAPNGLNLSNNAKQHVWGFNAAEMAYILFQKPVMVAVHAREMLRDAK